MNQHGFSPKRVVLGRRNFGEADRILSIIQKITVEFHLLLRESGAQKVKRGTLGNFFTG